MNTYGYVHQNPLKYTDPLGLAAQACLVPPISAACATAAQLAVDGIAVLVGLAMWVDNPEATKEWESYKDEYARPPPPGLDECELLSWKLKREQELLKRRIAWDAKWAPGRHANAIQQSNNAIKNIKEKMKRLNCEESCE